MNKLLLLCDKQHNTASTVYDHIGAIINYSNFDVDVMNPVKGPCLNKELVAGYDVIVIHYSVVIVLDSYLHPQDRYIISNYKGAKVVFIQDEYRWVNHTLDCLNAMSIDLLFTCIPSDEISNVYLKEHVPKLKCVNTLTGYVPEYLYNSSNQQSLPDYHERELDVVYRGRKLSAAYGRLAQEKSKIVDKLKSHPIIENIKHDLSYHEKDRLYGDDWINFIKNSKATLGTESGASVFDFTGDILKRVQAHEQAFPETSFDDLENLYFKDLDGKIKVNQISPRIFEAIALKTLLILYEGDYSGIIKPWQHFVPLKKDLSNINEVINFLKSPEKWRSMTERAFADVIASEKFSFENFVQDMDSEILQLMGLSITDISHKKKHGLLTASNKSETCAKNQVSKTTTQVFFKLNLILAKAGLFVFRQVKNIIHYVKRKLESLFQKQYNFIRVIYRRFTVFSIITAIIIKFEQKPSLYKIDEKSYKLCINDNCCKHDTACVSIIRHLPRLLFSQKVKLKSCAVCKWYYSGYSLS